MPKSRNWWFVLYPESAPDDWLSTLESTMVPFAVSPLHDKDIASDGHVKKPHFHIMLRYAGPTTYNHILELTRSLNQPIPQIYDSPKGAYDYLTHANNPEKAQYDIADIKTYNGFALPLNKGDDKMSVRREICSFIRDNKILEYSALVDVAMSLSDDWFKSVIKDCYFYNQYLRSIRFNVSLAVQQQSNLVLLSDFPPAGLQESLAMDAEQHASS